MKLTERLKQLRAENDVSQTEVAQSINIGLRTYHRYEKGEREPDASTLCALADYFGVSVDYLLGRSDQPNPKK